MTGVKDVGRIGKQSGVGKRGESSPIILKGVVSGVGDFGDDIGNWASAYSLYGDFMLGGERSPLSEMSSYTHEGYACHEPVCAHSSVVQCYIIRLIRL